MLEYIGIIIITFLGNLLLSKISGAFQTFGIMNALAFGVAFTKDGLKSLREFRKNALEEVEPGQACFRFLQRARLWGQIFASILHDIYALIFCAAFYPVFPSSSWILGLWALCVVVYSFTMAKMSFWWLLKSLFVKPDVLASEINEWQEKHALTS